MKIPLCPQCQKKGIGSFDNLNYEVTFSCITDDCEVDETSSVKFADLIKKGYDEV
ncbi:MAG: hypothetical protein OXC46_00855 [Thaumarchaeota archaeon]|nr:hypothetical protein [Nitrososphaerota archaeon]